MRSPSRPDLATLAGFAVMVVVLGLNFVAVRFSNRELDPFWGAALRFLVAAGLLGLAMLALRQRLPRGRALAGAVLYGALAFGANYGLIYWGMVQVGAGMAAVIFATMPLATLLMAAGVGLEKLRLRPVAGAVVALVGIAAIFREQVASEVPLAALLAVGAAMVTGAASGVVVKKAPRVHPVPMNAVGMAVGGLMLYAAARAAGDLRYLPMQDATWGAVAWLVGSSIVAFLLMVWVIGRWTASAASYVAVLMPLVTVVAASALAGEAVTLTFLGGAAVVLVGVYLGALHGPRPAPPPQPAAAAPERG